MFDPSMSVKTSLRVLAPGALVSPRLPIPYLYGRRKQGKMIVTQSDCEIFSRNTKSSNDIMK